MLAKKKMDEKNDQHENIYDAKRESSKWPKISNVAFQGLAGEIVETVEPHTESDPVTILGHTLCFFGNIIGRSAHFAVEAARHYTNENAIFIGQTSKGRKGTGEGIIQELFNLESPYAKDWRANRITSGLSSGEGIIYHVRDGDDGVKDKRLFIREPEFGGVLRALERNGNTLSALIRQSWDADVLSLLTRNNPLRATGAHISIIGHITAQELNRYLYDTEIFNGFANRFLWLSVKRSKLLPEGGKFFQLDFSKLKQKIERAIDFARTVKEVPRDDAARKIWIDIYPSLSEGKPGMAGAVLSRAEAHVMRLALNYALMDLSRAIKADHLCAALALWEYIEASVTYLFGDRTGNNIADRICDALTVTPAGLTRTDISHLFSKHEKSFRIDDAIQMLAECNKIEIFKIGNSGRPAEKIVLRDSQAK